MMVDDLSFSLVPGSSCDSAEEQEVGKVEEQQEEAAELDDDRIRLKACTCFIRTRCGMWL